MKFNRYSCKDCETKHIPKKIKCKTDYFSLLFKSTENNIDALEELLQGTIFELQIDAILDFYDID